MTRAPGIRYEPPVTMRLLPGSDLLDPCTPRPAVGIGNFDGVHLGHISLLRRLRQHATEGGGPATLLTFRPHPAQLLRPALAPPLLCDVDDERQLLAAAGVDLLVEEPFSLALARLEPRDFVRQVLQERLRARVVVVGFSFRFGAGAAGTPEELLRLLHAAGIAGEILPPVLLDDQPVSSTRIRALLGVGQVEQAARLLGRPFRLSGQVQRGDGRGRTLGFPTVNLLPTTPLVPADGVYAARVLLHETGQTRPAALCIGVRPTFGVQRRAIEAYLLDFEGDLYGQRVSVDLLAFLRPERRFPGPEALIAAMVEDVARVRTLASADLPPAPAGAARPC